MQKTISIEEEIALLTQRFPEQFEIAVKKDGRKLGVTVDNPADVVSSELRIQEVSNEGCIADSNASAMKAGEWHHVILPGMFIKTANLAEGDAEAIAKEMQVAEELRLRLRRPQLVNNVEQSSAGAFNAKQEAELAAGMVQKRMPIEDEMALRCQTDCQEAELAAGMVQKRMPIEDEMALRCQTDCQDDFASLRQNVASPPALDEVPVQKRMSIENEITLRCPTDCQEDPQEKIKKSPRTSLQKCITALKTGKWEDHDHTLRYASGEQDEKEIEEIDTSENATFLHILGFTVAVATPTAILLHFFSDVGIGVQTFETLLQLEFIGNLLVGLCVLAIFLLYVFDWSEFPLTPKSVSGLTLVYVLFLGGFFKSKSYPQAPLIIMLGQAPAILGALRFKMAKKVHKEQFYLGVSWACLVVGTAALAIWVCWIIGLFGEEHYWNKETKDDLIHRTSRIYDLWGVDYYLHCDPDTKLTTNEDGSELDKKLKVFRAKACGKAKTTWYLLWICPMICGGVLLLISLFCYARQHFLATEHQNSVEKALKAMVTVIGVLLAGMWVSASIAGASMQLAGTMMAFVYSSCLVTFVWIYLDVGHETIVTFSENSKYARAIIKLAKSEWAKALFIVMTNCLIPLAFFVSMINQLVRRCRRKSQSTSWFTDGTARKLEVMREWNWASILTKVHWIVILYFVLMVGVAKATYIFLSWLNVELQQVQFELVAVIFFVIGYLMFMLPPVPGVPVYIFGGIILAARGQSTDIGAWGGTVIALVLGYVLKLCAVAGQWSIGMKMGNSVRVQQLVGVDKVGIRAIEEILKRPFCFPKIAILVGGPDWPTSVLCGILKLNCLACVVGTMPCIFVAAPCVLVGSFLLRAEAETEGGFWGAIAGTTLIVATLGQSSAMLIAAYYMGEVSTAKEDELSKPRPEHAAVQELTRNEAKFYQCYAIVTRWKDMPAFPKTVLSTSTMSMLLAGFILVMADSACFRPFSLTSRISAPTEEGGLDGEPLNIILFGGWVAIFLFLLGCVLLKVFLRWATQETGRRLKSSTPEFSDLGQAPLPPPPGRDPEGEIEELS